MAKKKKKKKTVKKYTGEEEELPVANVYDIERAKLAKVDNIRKGKTRREIIEHNLSIMTEAQLQAIYQLKQVRKKLGWNQKVMADKLGISYHTITQWETASVKIRQPKILEYALRYLMNTYMVRTPLPGLASVVKEIQEEEKKRHGSESEGTEGQDRPSNQGSECKGGNSAK